MGALTTLGLPLVALFAVGFQVFLKDPVWLGLGIGKEFQPLSDFPYECHRIDNDPYLQGCEDMWLSEQTRVLYLACSDAMSRTHWFPSNNHFNLSGRSQKDAVVALQIDSPAGTSFKYNVLKTSGYAGTAGDGLLDLTGIAGLDVASKGKEREGDEDSIVELLLVNMRPSLDSTGKIAPDQSVTGGNSTIEVFQVRGRDAETMTHLHTVADPNIATPNNIALANNDNSKQFYVTNDHGLHKLGIRSHLSPLLGTGNVAFCTVGGGCEIVSEGHKYPNGLTQHDGLVYVPSSMYGGIQVYRIAEGNNGLEKVEDIPINYGLDNLAVDANGDIYVAAFPKGIEILQAFKDPYNSKPRSAVIRVRKAKNGTHSWEKILEDGEGGTLPGATTVVHDAKTGRLFLSGVISPFITVCEPRS